MKWRCEGYYDIRVRCSVEVEADDEREAEVEAQSRIESLDDIEEEDAGAGDVVETQVTSVTRAS